MNEGSRLLSVFIAPVRLFEDLFERSSRWWIPFIIILAVAALSALLLRLAIPPEVWLETLRQNFSAAGAEINQEQLQMAAERMTSPLALLFAGLGGLATSAVITFLLTLLFWAIFAIFGGKINFSRSITVVSYSGLITAFGIVVRVLLSIILQRLDIYTSLAILPFLERGSYLFRLASQIEFFMVWRVLIMGLGFSTLASVSRTKGYLIVILSWLVMAALISLVRFGSGM